MTNGKNNVRSVSGETSASEMTFFQMSSSMTREQQTKEIYNILHMQWPSEQHDAILALIDSATREARLEGYKKGYIDAGIKAITEQSGEREPFKGKEE